MFVSFFPKPKLFSHLGRRLELGAGVLSWFFGGQQLGRTFGMPAIACQSSAHSGQPNLSSDAVYLVLHLFRVGSGLFYLFLAQVFSAPLGEMVHSLRSVDPVL